MPAMLLMPMKWIRWKLVLTDKIGFTLKGRRVHPADKALQVHPAHKVKRAHRGARVLSESVVNKALKVFKGLRARKANRA